MTTTLQQSRLFRNGIQEEAPGPAEEGPETKAGDTFAQRCQSQKLESIGQLAGGIAHDFNNILTAILGQCSLAAADLGEGHPVYGQVIEIEHAAERAAALTRQLLAFSRMQPLEKTVFSVNTAVRNLEKMLFRLVGPDISFAQDLWAEYADVKADLGQVEQVIVNLVVNARDAMPHGGTLRIETENVTLDEAFCSLRPGLEPGLHVRLTVMDTGSGIPFEIQKRIFEPFFTTKGVDKGTGLGLSTVLDIVREHGGTISVQSEPGCGTSFSFLLPVTSDRSPKAREPLLTDWPRGTEQVLILEDDAGIRSLLTRLLRSLGYAVIEAGTARTAMHLLLEHQEREGRKIDILVADIMLPEVKGSSFGNLFSRIEPESAILYISGHIDEAVVGPILANPNYHFLSKPFSPLCLALKIREMLDMRIRRQEGRHRAPRVHEPHTP